MTVLDPITQAAVALQRRNEDGLSAPGAASIPVSFGHRVVTGFPIWVSQETAPSQPPVIVAGQLVHQKTSPPIQAGKTVATFAVALGYSILPVDERADTTIRRMWADDLLIYDATNPASAPDFNGMSLSFHPGNDDAMPDSFIAADMGALTPGFRNLIYVVLRDFPLQVGPTPVAPPPVQAAPVITKSSQTYPLPSLSTAGTPGAYDSGLVDVGVGGWGHQWLTGPDNIAYPNGGFGSVFISWITDAQATLGIGGGYNSLTGQVTPYPVDLGGGQQVIGADGSYGAIVETSVTTPGVITQAPAPSPTYRTTLPTIKVELADSVAISPIVSPYTLINANDPPGGDGGGPLGVMADWDNDITYAWTTRPSDDPQSFILHTYSVADKLEMQRFAPTNSYVVFPNTPDAVEFQGVRVHFDYLCAHDKVNQLAFTIGFSTGESNSSSIICVDLKTGKVASGYGLHSTATSDVPGVSVAERKRGDCVVSSSSFGRSYGLVSSSSLGATVGYSTYTTSGVLSHGGELDLVNPGFLDVSHPSSVLGYPIVGKPDLEARYSVSPLMTQDWFAFVAMGTALYIVHGDADSILDSQQVYTTGYDILATFIDQTDNSVMCIETDGHLNFFLEKIKVNTSFTAAGITPSFGGSAYCVPIKVPAEGNPMETSFRESQFLNGHLVYPAVDSGGKWVTYDMSTGTLIGEVVETPLDGVSATAKSFLYNSRTGTATVIGSGGEVAANVQLQSGTTGTIALNDALRWFMLGAGYTTDQIEIDASITDPVIGGVITSRVGLWSYLRNLSVVYNFSFYESEGKIKFVRGTNGDTATVTYTIDLDSLSAVNSSGDLSENLMTTLAAPIELATAVAVNYIDPDFGFQDNSKVFSRARFPYKDSRTGQTASYATYLVMNSAEALQRAARVAFTNYAQGVVQAMKLPWSFSRLEPSDSLNLIIHDKSYLVNITEVVFNTDWSLSLTGVDFNYRNDVNVSADAALGLTQQPSGPSDSLPLVIDSTLPAASDDAGPTTALLFTGVEGKGQAWWSGAAFNILDGSAWSQLYFTDQQVTYGLCTTALSATDFPHQTDHSSMDVLGISMRDGTGTATASQADFLAGTNAAFVGNTGRWELIYYKTITWNNARSFTITDIIRGRRGTETKCKTHQVGDYFVPFNRNLMHAFNLSSARIGASFSYAAVGKGTIKPATVVSTTLEANSLKPWAPHHVKVAVSGADAVITWARRDRITGSTIFVTTNVPMSETTEAYEVDLILAGAVKRTFTGLTTPTCTYTAAQQTADGFTSMPKSLTLRVYQISSVVGRGLTNEVTVNVQ